MKSSDFNSKSSPDDLEAQIIQPTPTIPKKASNESASSSLGISQELNLIPDFEKPGSAGNKEEMLEPSTFHTPIGPLSEKGVAGSSKLDTNVRKAPLTKTSVLKPPITTSPQATGKQNYPIEPDLVTVRNKVLQLV